MEVWQRCDSIDASTSQFYVTFALPRNTLHLFLYCQCIETGQIYHGDEEAINRLDIFHFHLALRLAHYFFLARKKRDGVNISFLPPSTKSSAVALSNALTLREPFGAILENSRVDTKE